MKFYIISWDIEKYILKSGLTSTLLLGLTWIETRVLVADTGTYSKPCPFCSCSFGMHDTQQSYV